MINKYIISTTINTPTDAIKKFDSLKDWKLIVAGDLKTPSNYKLKNGIYLNPRDQEKISKKLSDLIGWNCIQRRNFAMIVAYKKGADLIATIDDDNIPLPNWGKNLLIEKKIKIKKFITKEHAFDPLSVTNYSHLWHRGFPLQILKNKNKSNKIKKVNESFDIQADFWNGDPDIDAICRMEHSPECRFKEKVFPFTSNTPSNIAARLHVAKSCLGSPHAALEGGADHLLAQEDEAEVRHHLPAGPAPPARTIRPARTQPNPARASAAHACTRHRHTPCCASA